MKIKNTSSGSAILRLSDGSVLIAPNEVVEVDDRKLLRKRWQTISLHPALVRVYEDEKAVAEWHRSTLDESISNEVEGDLSDLSNDNESNGASGGSTNFVSGDSNGLSMGDAPTADELKRKLKSLRISWRKTQRVRTKATIAQEIKEIERQLEKVSK